MSELVDPDEVETIVGVPRHDTEHWARAVSDQQRVFILHSHTCKSSGRDLRDCPYSVALDRGISDMLPWTAWRRLQDRAVFVELYRGYLMPDFATYRSALL